jgi:hypothetical protein
MQQRTIIYPLGGTREQGAKRPKSNGAAAKVRDIICVKLIMTPSQLPSIAYAADTHACTPFHACPS